MTKEENVLNYYKLCNKLKNVIRTGWKNWNVQRERIESIAEHVFGTEMLAIAMKSEYNYDIDIMKVIYMIAIHELGESLIGDLTVFQISREEKEKIEHDAVHNILKSLVDSEYIEELFLEFDKRETKEAKFAYMCDKLECDIQCKIYDEEGCVDLSCCSNNCKCENREIQQLLKTENSWSNMWLKYSQKHNSYDENFMSVSNYILNNNIMEDTRDV